MHFEGWNNEIQERFIEIKLNVLDFKAIFIKDLKLTEIKRKQYLVSFNEDLWVNALSYYRSQNSSSKQRNEYNYTCK